MNWQTIDYNGTKIRAVDFLSGVVVVMAHDPDCFEGSMIFCPGYYVQERLGDMDGPALRPRKTKPQVFNLLAMEERDD